ICTHNQLKEITADLMSRASYRTLQKRYGISKSAVERHLNGHVSEALRRLTAAEGMSLADAAGIAEPVLQQMRHLHVRTLRILLDAEATKDHRTALNAISEARKNLELIGRIDGSLDPRSAGETPGAPLQVTIVYADKAAVVAPAPGPVLTNGD